MDNLDISRIIAGYMVEPVHEILPGYFVTINTPFKIDGVETFHDTKQLARI
jgi:hypothetical protein